MAKSREDKKRLLELLKESPNVTYACRRAGIARATYYRWIEDVEFKKKIDDAIQQGRSQVNDGVEAVLIKKAMSGNDNLIKYWLRHNHARYEEPGQKPCDLPHSQPLGKDELAAIERAMGRGPLGPQYKKDPIE